METLIEILEEINPDVDYRSCTTLIKDGYLNSFDLVMLVTEIGEEFDVSIPAEKIKPEYFNSVSSIYALIQELKEEN